MSERVLIQNKITSIPEHVEDEPSFEEKKENVILEVKPMEELEDELEEVKTQHIFQKPNNTKKKTKKQSKPKKELSQRQREHLQKMRNRRSEIAKAKKSNSNNQTIPVVEKQTIQQKTQPEHNISNIKKPRKPYTRKQPIQKKQIETQQSFNSNDFFNNMERMLDIMNKFKQYQQPVQRPVQRSVQQPVQQKPKQQPKKEEPKFKTVENEDPYNLNFLNGRSLYQNYKNPFNF